MLVHWYADFQFLGIGYLITERDELCADIGYNVLNNEEKCKDASIELNKNFSGVEHENDWPEGCYEARSTVYFNKHLIGSRRLSASQICESMDME